jgi:hypothetical protein
MSGIGQRVPVWDRQGAMDPVSALETHCARHWWRGWYGLSSYPCSRRFFAMIMVFLTSNFFPFCVCYFSSFSQVVCEFGIRTCLRQIQRMVRRLSRSTPTSVISHLVIRSRVNIGSLCEFPWVLSMTQYLIPYSGDCSGEISVFDNII